MDDNHDDDTTGNVHERAFALFDAGMIDESIALVKAEISRSPGNIDFYILLAGMYYDVNRYDDAREYAQAVAALEPGCDTAHRQLAWIEFRQNRFAASYEHANKALEIERDSTDNIYISAWSAYYCNKNKLAAELVERGLEIDPEIAQLHALSGIIAFSHKKYEKFDQAFQAALALHMEDPWIYRQYAECLMEIDRYYEAGEYYACAAKYDPENEDIKQGLHKSVQFILTSSLQPEKKVLAKLHPGVQQLYQEQHAKAGKLAQLPKWFTTTIILAILIMLWSVPPMMEYFRKASFGEWVKEWLYLGVGAILFVLIAPAIDEFLIKRKSKSRFKY